MKKYVVFLGVLLYATTALAEQPPPEEVLHADKAIYIGISEVHGPDGSTGTSADLNVLISQHASRTYSLETRFHSFSSPRRWDGVVRSYDRHNIKYMQGYKKCNYAKDALACGVKNKHWTLLTHVAVGKRYTSVTLSLYNERGQLLTSSEKTAWGVVIWEPNWKITKIKEWHSGDEFSPPRRSEMEMYEEWPPTMKELPPLVRPRHIYQAVSFCYLGLRRNFMRM